MSIRLDETGVKTTQPPAKGAMTLWDADITGFGLRVFAPTKRHPHGARSFFVNYRVDGTERRFTIGSFPDWSAKAAREEAKELRRRIDRGEDPASDRRERREAPTVMELAERYEREHLPGKAPQSRLNDMAMINNEILPRIGARKVADVHHGDILAIHQEITERGAPVRANRVLAVASKMFSLALNPMKGENAPWRNQAQGNPCKGVERNQEEGHERFFSEAEIAALTDALQAYGATSAANCLRFVMLTGCRPGEAMRATWEEFGEPGYWDKPSAHTKQRKRHRVPLSPAATELIAQIRATSAPDGQYVFPGQKKGQPLRQIRTAWEQITESATLSLWAQSSDPKAARVVADLEKALGRRPTVAECRTEAKRRNITLPVSVDDARAYDLRHTFASIGAGGGLSLQIIGRLLGRTQHRTTQRYAHFADDPLREAANKIGGVIANAGKGVDNVFALSKRGGVS
jgi:integrase